MMIAILLKFVVSNGVDYIKGKNLIQLARIDGAWNRNFF